jgi:hypothetical protein
MAKSKSTSKKMNKNNIKRVLKLISNHETKPLVNYGLYMFIFFNLLVILYTIGIIIYLNKLKECDCYKEKNSVNYSNLNYLIFIEAIILAVNVIYIFIAISFISFVNNYMVGGGMNDSLMYAVLLTNIVLYSFFIYYVYKIYQNVTIDCTCTQNWLRYLLYVQAGFMFIYVVTMVYNLTIGI